MKKGLVLEGGAMRGIYTAGVLDVFMEHDLTFDGVIGVSAGAIHGCSFVSGQHGRSIRYYLKYMRDPRFMSFRSLLTTGDLVGTQFCYHDIPEKLDVFDYDAFEKSKTKFYVVATNLLTGRAEYVHLDNMKDISWMQASASMPLVSHPVQIGGKRYLDGGVADSIPVQAFRKMGYEKNIVVLTRPEGYRKKASRMNAVKIVYKEYPAFVRAMQSRYRRYNQTLEGLEELEKQGQILILRPSRDLGIGRMEKRPDKVRSLYNLGREDAEAKIKQVQRFLREERRDRNGSI